MGKALVINGLTVTNPLTTVTIADRLAEAVLGKYLSANSTISSSEREALLDFVGGLIDANLWEKFSYFYPLLGASVSDMLLEAVDTEHEDIFANDAKTGLSVSNRTLIARERIDNTCKIGARAALLDKSKIGFICAGKSDSDVGGGQHFIFNCGNATFIGIEIVANSGYKYPCFKNGDSVMNEAPYNGNLDRVIFGTTVNGQGYLYDKTSLLASAAVTPPSGTPTETYGALSNHRSEDYKYSFFAITKGMTTDDWETIYPLINAFLQAVDKA